MQGAWRLAEYGPRKYIAHCLVMMKSKVLLAYTSKEFLLEDAYERYDKAHRREGLLTYKGERTRQNEEAAAHPSTHYV